MELEKARRKNMSNKVSFIAQVGYGTKVAPGCEIVVPSKPKSKRMSTSEVLSIASGTASLATMIATLANLLK